MLLQLLSRKTLLDEKYIMQICNSSNSFYSRFFIDKPNGGKRKIHHPHKELKLFQRILHDNILSQLTIHPSSMAYSPGSSIKQNAEKHMLNQFILRMDFKSFFESISYKDVYAFCETAICNKFIGWTKEDSEIFSKFACYKESLVMGSVTSPSLTNAMLYDFDEAMHFLATSKNIIYTRYADDLYFSTDTRGVLKSVESEVNTFVLKMKIPKKLKINQSKTFHSSKKRKRVVTGLVITNDGQVSIGRNKKREIRSLVFQWDDLPNERKSFLAGYLSYVKSIEPNFINKLCMKYGASRVSNILSYINEK